MSGLEEYTEGDVELASIAPRPGNRPVRRVEELAEAIRDHGLINRVIVCRRVGQGTSYELIAGARRLAAHQLLGRATVAAKIYGDLPAAKTEELGDIDNLQREDLTPIEQGEAYHRLADWYDAAEIARRVGRTAEHVRQRMRLADLHEPIRELVADELLDIGAAELIAQTPLDVQKKLVPRLQRATATAAKVAPQREPWSMRVSRRDVQEMIDEYSRALDDAPFDITDEQLVEQAGACSRCDRRTGVQGVLVEVLDATDTCLDVPCWDRKVAANRKRVEADAKKRGLKVLSDTEAKSVFLGNENGRTAYAAKFRGVTEKVYSPSTGREVAVSSLIDETVPRVLAFDGGRPVELVPREVVDVALKERAKTASKGTTAAQSAQKKEGAAARDVRKRREHQKVLKRSRAVAMKAVSEIVRSGRVSVVTVLRTVVARCGITEAEEMCRILGIEAKSDGAIEALLKTADKVCAEQKTADLKARHLAALVAQLVTISSISVATWGEQNQKTPKELEAFDVDLAACRRTAKAELDAEASSKGSKAKPKPAKQAQKPKRAARAAHAITPF